MSKRITKYSNEYWLQRGYSKEESKQKILEFKQLNRKNKKICKEYWMHRGLSEKDSIIQVKKFQSEQSKKRKDKFTPSQIEFWKKQGYSEEESKQKIKENVEKSCVLKISSWIHKGFTKEEAIEKIKLIQISNSSKVKNRKNGRSIEEIMNRGYTEKEAILKLKKLQSTNTLENYTKKYGSIGEEIWRERQIKWQETLNNNYSKEERKKWSSFTYNDYIKKYGKERADKWLKNKIHFGKTYSKISQILFKKINEYISGEFYYGEKEYVLKREKWTYILDFYDKNSKKVIEFNGDLWHANPKIYEHYEICNPFSRETAKEIWERDEIRFKNILMHKDVNDILVVWEKDFKENKEKVINQCVNFLKNE
jgi:hypothetical protein